jgi:hypothetical protein
MHYKFDKPVSISSQIVCKDLKQKLGTYKGVYILIYPG